MSGSEPSRKPGVLKDYFGPVASPGSYLNRSQTVSPRSTPKSVSIANNPDAISPLILGNSKDVDDLSLDRGPTSPKKIRVKGPSSRKLSGKPSQQLSISSLQNLNESTPDVADCDSTPNQAEFHAFPAAVVRQIEGWIAAEKAKKERRRAKQKDKHHHRFHLHRHKVESDPEGSDESRRRRGSDASDDSVDLSKLEQILQESLPAKVRFPHRGSSTSLLRKSSTRKLHRASTIGATSDTEYLDGDVLVPSAEAWLDNSKTVGYSGGAAQSTEELALTRQLTASQEAWGSFKFEIVRLTHTLRLKGWRRVPMDMSSEIEVSRLSGALTNAVYVVSPPHYLIDQCTGGDSKMRGPPPKLLLRIYGPQVEHLIDRDNELQILKRLARKKIGPRLLGTFSNGRFEEFFNACPLTPQELRNSDTSRQIAKRMRELHDGVDLLDIERDKGPLVWQNWDKWLHRVESIVTWLDAQISGGDELQDSTNERRFVCGTQWPVFKNTYDQYRRWLSKQCGGSKRLREELVFAHNDTQYGNILRLLPSDASPLLLPANTHKQLIVIDFEYANANTPGLEFANHFTEWCYDYHDEARPWRCNTAMYPTPEEQIRFLRAYVRHRPDFNISTPRMLPLDSPIEATQSPASLSSSKTEDRRPGPSQSISNFMQDARGPPSASTSSSFSSSFVSLPPPATAPDTATEGSVGGGNESLEQAEVAGLIKQTRLWRMANTAQWVAWGMVQAKIPGMPLFSPEATKDETASSDMDNGNGGDDEGLQAEKRFADLTLREESPAAKERAQEEIKENDEEEEKEEEFDYLAYARDRAMLFWGDAVNLGFVKLEDLPEDVRRDIKIVEY